MLPSIDLKDQIKILDFNDRTIKSYFEEKKTYKAFEDSWFALIQGVRQNPRCFKSKIFFADHPHKKDSLISYNHLCLDYKELSVSFTDLLRATNKKEIIWKNAVPEDLPLLLKYGFEICKEDYSWDANSRFDDQTYPQHMCLVENLKTLQSKSLAQLRQQMRSVERNYKELEITLYQPTQHRTLCVNLVQQSALGISASTEASLTEIFSANIIYLDHAPDHSYIVKYNNKIIAFVAFDIRGSIANFNCLAYDKTIKYIASYTMMKVGEILSRDKVEWINMSGSENKLLDHWKQKFHPIFSISRTHVIFRSHM